MADIISSIVIYNCDAAMLDRTVACFLETRLDVELILVDNSPGDAFRGRWQDPRITYIYNGRNLGLGAAQNIAIAQSLAKKPKYHLVLNPDIYFEPGALEKLFQYMLLETG